MATTVSILGSTGSIGTQALDVIGSHPGRFEVTALAASRPSRELLAQVERWRPSLVSLATAEAAAELAGLIDSSVEVLAGASGLEQAAASAEVALNAVVGFAGLPATMAALSAGRRLALANKESLIAAAPLVATVRGTKGAEIVPVDSEHCAIHQCLLGVSSPSALKRLILTASGGPFRGRSLEELRSVSVDDALAHPTWAMGPKITIDSSTLMNKGLEVIEAQALFGVGVDEIDVVIHPQSIVHSMVELVDGSTIAQLSMPDMRLPISYALGFPERLDVAFGAIDWSRPSTLSFEPPDLERFACLALACEAGRSGGAAPAWLSAANEVAVEAFLAGRIAWLDIAGLVAAAMDAFAPRSLERIGDVLEADRAARDVTIGLLAARMDT